MTQGLTFSDLYVFSIAGQGTVDLPNQLHVVQQGIKAIKVGEADLVRYGTSSGLQGNTGGKAEGIVSRTSKPKIYEDDNVSCQRKYISPANKLQGSTSRGTKQIHMAADYTGPAGADLQG